MNIFAVDKNPEIAATQLLDKHIVKMPTESCQMLHTNITYMLYVKEHGEEPQLKDLKAFHLSTGSELMKPAMLNHPSTIWARQSVANFHWLYQHGIALCEEYTRRYDKVHRSQDRIIIGMRVFHNIDYTFPVKTLTPVTIAMFDQYRLDEKEYYNRNPNATGWDFVIASYRHYYLEGKWRIAKWKNDNRPEWFPANHYARKYNIGIRAYNTAEERKYPLRELNEEL
tara:strand:+ start:68 stop:745 length:678 start_codon:yes stop_codon:yes gene_type:complete